MKKLKENAQINLRKTKPVVASTDYHLTKLNKSFNNTGLCSLEHQIMFGS
jgi:hypothetical protein